MINVIINGAYGKMGRVACEALAHDPRFHVVGALTKTDNLGHCIQALTPQVVVDFTRADVVYRHAETMIEAGVHPVIGTSGLTSPQIDILTQQCRKKKLGGLIIPNFSIGVLLMMHFAQHAARYFKDIEILEMHHQQKVDAPSATAIRTAQMIQENSHTTDIENVPTNPARGHKVFGIPIHALRLPGVLAKQSVIFGGLGEQLTITHESIDRQCFIPGLLLACERVVMLHEMKYGLEHVIEAL